MPLIDRLKPHWRPLAASSLLVALGLIAALLHGYSSLQSQREQLDEFGQALARSAAQRAVDATLSQDMISLQVVLREVTRHPRVVGATIHDVESRLLVQSGSSPTMHRRGRSGATPPPWRWTTTLPAIWSWRWRRSEWAAGTRTFSGSGA